MHTNSSHLGQRGFLPGESSAEQQQQDAMQSAPLQCRCQLLQRGALHSAQPGLLTAVSFTLGAGSVRDHRKSNPGHSIFFTPHSSWTQTAISQVPALYIDLDWSLTIFLLQDPRCLQAVVGYFCKSLSYKGSNSLRGSVKYIELYNMLPRDTASALRIKCGSRITFPSFWQSKG